MVHVPQSIKDFLTVVNEHQQDSATKHYSANALNSTLIIKSSVNNVMSDAICIGKI